MRSQIRVSAVALAVVALVAGCVQQGPVDSAPSASGSPKEIVSPEEVVIGAVYPLTGPLATAGRDAKNGLDLAVELINSGNADLNLPLVRDGGGLENLGGAKLRIVIADHQNDPLKALSATERLITDDKVIAMLGGYSSSAIATASQATERLGIPYVSGLGSSPELANRGFKWFFHVQPDDQMFSENVFQFLDDVVKKFPDTAKKVAILHTDDLFGSDLSKFAHEIAKQYGYEVVTDVAYVQTTPDLTSEIQRLKASEADILISANYLSDATLAIKGLKQQGVHFKAIIGHNAFTDSQFIPNLGKDAEGIIQREAFGADLGLTKPLVKQVNDLFRAKYGTDMNGIAAREFTGVFVLAEAINRAASLEPAEIQAALKETDIKGDEIVTPWDGVRFDERGQNTLGAAIMLQIQNGKYVTVWPPELATKDLVWPLP